MEGPRRHRGQKVIYDPEQPSYNSEAQRITSGDPDGFVIVDFPETYQKMGPALVRTGKWDAKKSFVTDGLASTDLPKNVGAEATEGLRGTTVGTFEGAAPEAFDKLYTSGSGPDRQTFDAQNFDAVMLCYLAAVAAGSADAEDIKGELQNVSGHPARIRSSSCRKRSGRCRTARRSTMTVLPGRSTWTTTAIRAGGSTASSGSRTASWNGQEGDSKGERHVGRDAAGGRRAKRRPPRSPGPPARRLSARGRRPGRVPQPSRRTTAPSEPSNLLAPRSST